MPSRVNGPRSFTDDLGVYGLPGDVSPWDIRFHPNDRAFVDRETDGRFRVRVWAEPGLTDGLVVVRRGREVLGYPLEVVATTLRFVFFELVGDLQPGDQFSLAFRDPAGQAVYRVPTGISNAVERLDRWVLADLASMEIPEWVRGAVIYQIYPDRFANGNPGNDPHDTDPWGSPPHSRRFQGGDLQGVTAHLDYLTGLGVDLIYLNPIFASPSNHRYDVTDYHQVDPILGGNEALRELVEAAHGRGMRVIVDASFNHCHPLFFAFQDLIRNGPDSGYRNWFVVNDWPVRIKVRPPVKGWRKEWLPVWSEQTGLDLDYVDDPGPPLETTYESWYGVPTMPRINLADPQARHYMLEVATDWVGDAGIDGWRMDVARYVDPDFWVDFRRAVKSVNPGAYLVGEFMGDVGRWLQGDCFDATMNYTFRDIALRFLAREEIDAAGALDGLARLWAQYAWPVTLANQNLIGSHDTPRFLSVAGNKTWRLRLATILQMTYPGAPGLYYGDEIGLTGDDDPGSRGAFRWEPDPGSHPIVAVISSLSDLRRRHPALARGGWRALPSEGHLLAFERRFDGERLAVVLNRGGSRRVDLPVSGGRLLWGDGVVSGKTLTIGRHGAAIVKLRSRK
ncbi:MAG: glycoside hydrolase family 13 protein [Acidimicrobiia bacterium]